MQHLQVAFDFYQTDNVCLQIASLDICSSIPSFQYRIIPHFSRHYPTFTEIQRFITKTQHLSADIHSDPIPRKWLIFPTMNQLLSLNPFPFTGVQKMIRKNITIPIKFRPSFLTSHFMHRKPIVCLSLCSFSKKAPISTLKVKESLNDTDRPFLDIVNELKANHFDLSSSSNIDHESDSNSWDRIMIILRIYSLWIGRKQQQRQRQSNSPSVSMRELVDGQLDGLYKWKTFVSDYNAVLRTRGKGSRKRSGLTEWECSGTKCTINGRHHRDRTFYGQNRVEREALYFIEREHGGLVDAEADDDEDVVRELVTQQMLDTLHCLVLHSVSMPLELNKLLHDDIKTVDNEQDLCHDSVLQKVLDLVERERQRTRRRRQNADDKKYNKFMTKKEVHTDSVSTTNISEHRCFLDILVDELEKGHVAKQQIEAFYRFLKDDCHDTDSVMDDIAQKDADDTNSNLIRRGKMQSESTSKILSIARRLCLEKRIRSSMYSPGFRYFYWPFYAKNENERNELWGNCYEENEGYKLKDWFVAKKYGNLKEETLNNKVAPFSLHQFKVTLSKSNEKLSAWNEDKRARRLVCEDTEYEKRYGIKVGDRITVKHVQSLLFYTNYSKECYLFGATYRKNSELESDESLQERHSEVAIWGRLLRETVEVFGTMMHHSNISRFYHGVSEELYFASTGIKLCGPTSTTGGLYNFVVSLPVFAYVLFSTSNRQTFWLLRDASRRTVW